MKKLQKRNLGVFGVITCILAMLFTVNVYAETCTNPAAKIGETCYDDLQAAFTAVTNNQEIIILKEVDLNSGYVLAQNDVTYSVNLNGQTIKSSGGGTIYFAKGTVEVKGNGTIENNSSVAGSAALVSYYDAHVKLSGGTYKNTNPNGNTVSVGAPVSNTSTSGNLVFTGSARVDSEGNGIIVWADGSKLDITGGSVSSKGFAVAGNGSKTTNSVITINGGELKSTGTAAIYQPQEGSLTITGGTITGKIGIVARQGDVKIEGGIITGNGDKDEEISTGDAQDSNGNVKLQNGAAVVVDNKSTGYGSPTIVTISKGEFHATSENAVESLGDNATDYSISGGSYDKPVDKKFVDEDKTELSIGTTGSDIKTWYIGNDAKTAVANAVKNENSIIEIEQGDIEIEGAVTGVKVKNNGSGNVTINSEKVESGKDVIATALYRIQIGEQLFEVTEGTTFADFFTDNEDALNAYISLCETIFEKYGITSQEDYENKVSEIYLVNLLTNEKLENVSEIAITKDYKLNVEVVLKEPAETEPPVQTGDNIIMYSVMGLVSLGALAIGSKKVLKRN